MHFEADARERKAAGIATVIQALAPNKTIATLRAMPMALWADLARAAVLAKDPLHSGKVKPPSSKTRRRALQIIGYRRRMAAMDRRATL